MILAVLFVMTPSAQGQALGGFFDQGASELKDYAAQIVALEIYVNKAREGYKIVETGLTDIGDIHQAEYALHEAYFGSLAAVNPEIAGRPEVVEIVRLQASVGESGAADLVELAELLTPGKLTMTDDQRMKRILALDKDMKRRFVLVQLVSVDSAVLKGERQAAANNAGMLKLAYGLQ